MISRSTTASGGDYRFGFNGMEKDDEVCGATGTSYDFGSRIYDVRIGRWLSLDPMSTTYPALSNYAYVNNSVLVFIDPNGREIVITVAPGSPEHQQVSHALGIIQIMYPERYKQLVESKIVYEIGVGSLNQTTAPVPKIDWTAGQTAVPFEWKGGLTAIPTRDQAGELTGASLKRHRTEKEQAVWAVV